MFASMFRSSDFTRRGRPFPALAAVLVISACGGDTTGPTAPPPADPIDLSGNPERGEVAFVENCASCHSSRDGFDLAAFEFTKFDVVRRGIAHVDSATSRDIAAHIERLSAQSVRRHIAPFQPGGKVLGTRPFFSTASSADDMDFWIGIFGTTGWPDGMTAEGLRAVDPRDYPVPLQMPLWSMEGSNEDWMPDGPIPSEIMTIDGGRLESAIEAYYASPTQTSLIEAMRVFREVTVGAGRACWREDPIPCFDARRWMASLGAQHYLREGPDADVPAEVAQLWWDVGESEIALQAISRNVEERDAAFRSGSKWMYVAFSYAPDGFREPAGYMGTFLNSQGLRRVALFAALRRMVGDGLAHAEHADQVIEDAQLAIRRADFQVGSDVVEFSFRHMVDRLEAEMRPDLDLLAARQKLDEMWDSARRFSNNSAQWGRIYDLHGRLVELLH